MKNISKLVKKIVVDKNGVRRTVWVKTDTSTEKKRRKSHDLTSGFESNLRKVNRDLKKDNLDYKQALTLKMIMMHGFRVGNEESAAGFERHGSKQVEQTFGLLTLKKNHFSFPSSGEVVINFKGKKGVDRIVNIKDKSLVEGIKHFYSKAKKDDSVLGMTNYELRKYINRRISNEFSPKDFRMMRANLEASKKSQEILKRRTKPKNKTELNEEINTILNHVSATLGNTKGVAKRSYVDDNIIQEHSKKRGF